MVDGYESTAAMKLQKPHACMLSALFTNQVLVTSRKYHNNAHFQAQVYEIFIAIA